MENGGAIIPFVILLWGQKTDDTESLVVMQGCIPERALGTHALAWLLDGTTLSLYRLLRSPSVQHHIRVCITSPLAVLLKGNIFIPKNKGRIPEE